MTNNTKTPTPANSEADAVELTEAELDQASGGSYSFGASNAGQVPTIKAVTQKPGDGSVKPAGGQPNGVLAALESAIHA